MNYATEQVRDQVTETALRFNVYPDELESENIIRFIRDKEGYIEGCEFIR